jgi:hypothetical protein
MARPMPRVEPVMTATFPGHIEQAHVSLPDVGPARCRFGLEFELSSV